MNTYTQRRSAARAAANRLGRFHAVLDCITIGAAYVGLAVAGLLMLGMIAHGLQVAS